MRPWEQDAGRQGGALEGLEQLPQSRFRQVPSGRKTAGSAPGLYVCPPPDLTGYAPFPRVVLPQPDAEDRYGIGPTMISEGSILKKFPIFSGQSVQTYKNLIYSSSTSNKNSCNSSRYLNNDCIFIKFPVYFLAFFMPADLLQSCFCIPSGRSIRTQWGQGTSNVTEKRVRAGLVCRRAPMVKGDPDAVIGRCRPASCPLQIPSNSGVEACLRSNEILATIDLSGRVSPRQSPRSMTSPYKPTTPMA